KAYVAVNPPVGADIYYHLKAPAKEVSITILDANKPAPAKELKIDTFGRRMRRLAGPKDAGLHRVSWDLWNDFRRAEMVAPGEYTVELNVDGQRLTQKLRVEE